LPRPRAGQAAARIVSVATHRSTQRIEPPSSRGGPVEARLAT
jgi:hypothetical protein